MNDRVRHRRAAPHLAGLAAALLLFSPLPAVGGTVRVGFVHDDNLSHSAAGGVADRALTAAWSVDSRRVLSRAWQLGTGATLAADDWLEWDGFDQFKPELRAGLIRKFGFGAYAPALAFDVSAAYALRHYEGARGPALAAGVTYRQRLTPLLAWSAGAAWDDFAARSDIYSRDGHGVHLRLDIDPSPDWRVSLQARRRWGDLNGHFRGASPLGDSLLGPQWTTTRFTATTTGATGALSRTWGRATTLAAQFDYASSRGAGRRYLNRITSVTLAHAF